MISVLAFLLALGAAELALRWWVKPSRLYSTIRSAPAANQWKNEVRFWERHIDREDSLIAGHDPLLGWDFDIRGDRIRGSGPVQRDPQSTTIVALGDSFTYGNEVGETENFAALLDADPEYQVLNMAIPGYGIGQAYLKYRQFGAAHNPDVILLGIYVDDYERTSVGFTSSAKPSFAIAGNALQVLGQPVPTPQQQLTRIGQRLDGRVYIVDAVANLWRKATTGQAQEDAYFATTDAIVAQMLKELRDGLADHQRLMIVHIPRAESFVDADPFRQAMSTRLLGIYERLGLNHIDLAAEFVATATAQDIYATHYVHREGGSVGHLSARGHDRVAELVRQALKAKP